MSATQESFLWTHVSPCPHCDMISPVIVGLGSVERVLAWYWVPAISVLGLWRKENTLVQEF